MKTYTSTEIAFPTYPDTETWRHYVNNALPASDETQGVLIAYEVYQHTITKQIHVAIKQMALLDTFGVGYSDLSTAQHHAGILELFTLQHFKNKKHPKNFLPYTIITELEIPEQYQ